MVNILNYFQLGFFVFTHCPLEGFVTRASLTPPSRMGCSEAVVELPHLATEN